MPAARSDVMADDMRNMMELMLDGGGGGMAAESGTNQGDPATSRVFIPNPLVFLTSVEDFCIPNLPPCTIAMQGG